MHYLSQIVMCGTLNLRLPTYTRKHKYKVFLHLNLVQSFYKLLFFSCDIKQFCVDEMPYTATCGLGLILRLNENDLYHFRHKHG